MSRSSFIASAAVALLAIVSSAQAEFIIQSATGTFTPSFRGDSNTTHFGWGEGQFDATPGLSGSPEETNERLYPRNSVPAGQNPLTPTIGGYPVGNLGDFYQTNWATPGAGPFNTNDVISSTNNVYSSGNSSIDLTMIIPTNGVLDTGFTTIVIQGKALPSVTQIPDFLAILTDEGPVTPSEVVFGLNAQNPDKYLQFWVKYELTGNELAYALQMTKSSLGHGNPISISHLEVDTVWSPTAFAADFATLPEPASLGMLALGACGLLARRRKPQA